MKTSQFAVLIVTLVLGIVLLAYGQSYGGFGYAPIAPAVSNCPPGQSTYTVFCTVGSATTGYQIYVSYNAGAYQLLVPANAPAGVTSFNGRTGAVTLLKADVTGTGVAVTSTATTTVNSAIQ